MRANSIKEHITCLHVHPRPGGVVLPPPVVAEDRAAVGAADAFWHAGGATCHDDVGSGVEGGANVVGERRAGGVMHDCTPVAGTVARRRRRRRRRRRGLWHCDRLSAVHREAALPRGYPAGERLLCDDHLGLAVLEHTGEERRRRAARLYASCRDRSSEEKKEKEKEKRIVALR